MYNHYNPCIIQHRVTVALPLLVWLIFGLIPPKSVLGWNLHTLHVVQAVVIGMLYLRNTSTALQSLALWFSGDTYSVVLLQRPTTMQVASLRITIWEWFSIKLLTKI